MGTSSAISRPSRGAERSLLLVLLLAVAAVGELKPDDATPLGMRQPVVLIHGWNADPSTFDEFARQLRAHPVAARRLKVYRFRYDWSRSIAASADSLRADLQSTTELAGRPVALVGHSMGGLVARGYVESRRPGFDGPARVGLLITLATPHHGSPTANLEWVSGESKYTLLTRLMPVGLLDLLVKIPIFAAVRTEGGHNLGWDNYDATMPPVIWAGADRFIQQLNADLADHPRRDELLLRYRLFAGYLSDVPALSLPGLVGQVRAGDHYGAGCSLLAHAFRNDNGEQLTRWALNDGVVPLDSACFLRPGPPLSERADGAIQVRTQRIAERTQPSAVPARVTAGVDHSAITRDPRVVSQVLGELVAYEPNALAYVVDGQLVVRRPGGDARPVAPLAGRAIRGMGPAALLTQATGGAVELITPTARRVITPGQGGVRVSPDGLAMATDGGLLLRLDVAGAADLGTSAPRWIWSPDGRRGAFSDGDGRLVLLDRETMAGRPALRDGQPLAPGVRPLAWQADGRLLAGADDGLLQAAASPDGGRLALVTPGGALTVLRLNGDSVDASFGLNVPIAAPRVVLVVPGAAPRELSAGGREPVWAADGAWLAWLDGATSLGVLRGEQVTMLELGGPAYPPLPLGDGTLLIAVGVTGADQPTRRLLRVDPAAGTVGEVARAVGLPGEIRLSPDRRFAVIETADGNWIVALDGSWQEHWPGAGPAWLPTPADWRWTAGAPRP